MSFPSRRAVGLLDLLPDDERTRLGDRVRTRMDFFPGPVWATETSSTCAYAGNGTIVYTGRLGYSEAPVMIGIASCSPTDTFDYDVGTRIAYVRCAEAGYRWVQGNIDPNELHGECNKAIGKAEDFDSMFKKAADEANKAWNEPMSEADRGTLDDITKAADEAAE